MERVNLENMRDDFFLSPLMEDNLSSDPVRRVSRSKGELRTS